MNIQTQPNGWSCVPTSFAMVLGIPVSNLFSEIGHDGSEMIDGSEKGFHIQECIYCAARRGYSVTPLQFKPVATPDGRSMRYYDFEKEIVNIMRWSCGVITGIGLHSNQRHAVAWNAGVAHDPNGLTYPLSDFENHFSPDCFWLIKQMQNQIIPGYYDKIS